MAEISGNLGLCYKCGGFFDKCDDYEISVRRVLFFYFPMNGSYPANDFVFGKIQVRSNRLA